MNNEENGSSLEPEDIPSTVTGSKPETTKLPKAGTEDTNPDAPIATETPAAVEAVEQPVDADGSPSPSVESVPRTDEAVPPIPVQPVSLKEPRSFSGEQPLPIIEMAPRVLRYRTRRDLLLFSAGAVAAAGRRWSSPATNYAQSHGCASRYELSWEGVAAEQGIAYRR